MEIERRIYNKNSYSYYGVYILKNFDGYEWVYLNGSLLWDKNRSDKYASIYVDDLDGPYIKFKECHLDEDTTPNL